MRRISIPAVLLVASVFSAAFIANVANAGVEGWKGKLNKSLEITVTEPGVYGYKCQPHFGLGMVGMFVVTGAPANLETAKAVKVRGRKPKKAFKKLFEQATVQ